MGGKVGVHSLVVVAVGTSECFVIVLLSVRRVPYLTLDLQSEGVA